MRRFQSKFPLSGGTCSVANCLGSQGGAVPFLSLFSSLVSKLKMAQVVLQPLGRFSLSGFADTRLISVKFDPLLPTFSPLKSQLSSCAFLFTLHLISLCSPLPGSPVLSSWLQAPSLFPLSCCHAEPLELFCWRKARVKSPHSPALT